MTLLTWVDNTTKNNINKIPAETTKKISENASLKKINGICLKYLELYMD